jgi:hypothetical protein
MLCPPNKRLVAALGGYVYKQRFEESEAFGFV